jgi:hypothetical protein
MSLEDSSLLLAWVGFIFRIEETSREPFLAPAHHRPMKSNPLLPTFLAYFVGKWGQQRLA